MTRCDVGGVRTATDSIRDSAGLSTSHVLARLVGIQRSLLTCVLGSVPPNFPFTPLLRYDLAMNRELSQLAFGFTLQDQ